MLGTMVGVPARSADAVQGIAFIAVVVPFPFTLRAYRKRTGAESQVDGPKTSHIGRFSAHQHRAAAAAWAAARSA